MRSGETLRRVPLPTYPFERSRHWVEPDAGEDDKKRRRAAKRHSRAADWFYLPGWKQATPAHLLGSSWREETRTRWLIFLGTEPIGPAVVGQLQQLRPDDEFVLVERGPRLERTGGAASWRLDPADREAYATLVAELGDGLPLRVVHLWNARPVPDAAGVSFDGTLDEAFFSVTWLTRALATSAAPGDVRLAVLTTGAQDVFGNEPLDPARASVFGPAVVGPQEHGRLRVRWIDVDDGAADCVRGAMIARELLAGGSDPIVASRHGTRWLPTCERVPLDEDLPAKLPLRFRGVYLDHRRAGTYPIGHCLDAGADLPGATAARGPQSPLPAREQWDQWLASHEDGDQTSVRIARVRAIEAGGGEVRVVAADVTDEGQLARALGEAEEAFGRIDAVFSAVGDPGPSAFAPISTVGRGQAAAQFAPKLQGLALLERVLGPCRIDFCVVPARSRRSSEGSATRPTRRQTARWTRSCASTIAGPAPRRGWRWTGMRSATKATRPRRCSVRSRSARSTPPARSATR